MKLQEIKRLYYYDGSIIQNESDLTENIPKIEKLFRNSKIYKQYIYSIREGLEINKCSYFKENDFEHVDLELHHILTLYNIVMIVGSKMLSELKRGHFLTVYDVVKGVVEFHMKDYAVIMMLSKTIHQLHHTGQYSLPKHSDQFYSGNYEGFIKEYKQYLNENEIINLYKYFDIDVSEYFKEKEV